MNVPIINKIYNSIAFRLLNFIKNMLDAENCVSNINSMTTDFMQLLL